MAKNAPSRVGFQTPRDKSHDRSDHIWFLQSGGGGVTYKCCLCGGLTLNPPNYPTPKHWLPTEFEDLTDAERQLVPFVLGCGSPRD